MLMDDFMVSDHSQLVATAVGDANGQAFWVAPPGCSSAVPDYNEWQSTVEIDGINFQPEVEMCFDDLVNGSWGSVWFECI
ncbi:hypothetical protein QJS04_geneDACA001752 [Acorus gramineus]|uniref:Uncharacterized protein n=1 Tax=Acorus gramineus TaxID=55184 RepID=A0AAV9BIA3_ACOGR|nr:hypothetical protein QJS04_geneDACA001752 [Acorus gramineus]